MAESLPPWLGNSSCVILNVAQAINSINYIDDDRKEGFRGQEK